MKKVKLEFKAGDKINLEEIEKGLKNLFEGANSWLIMTDNGGSAVGYFLDVQLLLVELIRELNKEISEDVLREVIELAFLSDEEVEKRVKETIDEVSRFLVNLKEEE